MGITYPPSWGRIYLSLILHNRRRAYYLRYVSIYDDLAGQREHVRGTLPVSAGVIGRDNYRQLVPRILHGGSAEGWGIGGIGLVPMDSAGP